MKRIPETITFLQETLLLLKTMKLHDEGYKLQKNALCKIYKKLKKIRNTLISTDNWHREDFVFDLFHTTRHQEFSQTSELSLYIYIRMGKKFWEDPLQDQGIISFTAKENSEISTSEICRKLKTPDEIMFYTKEETVEIDRVIACISCMMAGIAGEVAYSTIFADKIR